eukprot:Polyplicarium_translucidae@DN3159_c0_g1_i2.p3
MDRLRGLVAEKARAVPQGQKWVRRSDMLREDAGRLQKDDAAAAKKRAEREALNLRELSDHLDSKTAAAKGEEKPTEDVDRDKATTADVAQDEANQAAALPRNEVVRRLRKFAEPATLFGETDAQRYRRMCALELHHHEDEMMGGQKNVFLESFGGRTPKRRRDDVANDDDEDLFAHEAAPSEAESTSTTEKCSKKLSIPDEAEAEAEPTPSSGPQKCEIILKWIRRMLHEWEAELVEKSEAEKQTVRGRRDIALHRQTRRDVRPLLRLLKQAGMEADVVEKLYNIVLCCEEKEYKSAHDKYIELAIGNAAWPMGVTMVGIHERAGRSKIFTSEIAHVLNDETTRKYIQMFKRLMSFCQRKFPTDDPSHMICISTTHV